MQWQAEMRVSRAAELDTIPTGITLPIQEKIFVREERDILRMVLEMWLAANSDPIDGLKHDQWYWDRFEICTIGD